jgi:hypothetical protein
MVNREKRQVAKQLIEQFTSCEITNDDFRDGFPIDKLDPALEAIYCNLWVHYSDTRKHKLEEKHTLGPEAKELFRRCAAFLGTDLEYEWPPYKWVSVRWVFLRLFRLTKRIDQEFEIFKAHGDFTVWPFIRERDYMCSISNTSVGGAAVSPSGFRSLN